MPVDYIPRTRELYAPKPPYRWADNRGEPVPWTPLRKPLAECRVALGASGGVYVSGQEPFHFKDDTSIRTIPADIEIGALRVAHFGYPTGDAERDPNCVFPLERLRELAADGTIGELAPTAISWMGGIYSQRRVLSELAPAILAELRAQDVDLFYIVPA
ncbi:MAG: hypothetical protein D6760_00710 [Deltaproteobacteria bacterium]|nr:MAG: hypothetical protein D6760_00710 [Deltaproteobacteria bacterium]